MYSQSYAPVAQWIERQPPELEVAGSNPAGRAMHLRHFPPWIQTIFDIRINHRHALLAQPPPWERQALAWHAFKTGQSPLFTDKPIYCAWNIKGVNCFEKPTPHRAIARV